MVEHCYKVAPTEHTGKKKRENLARTKSSYHIGEYLPGEGEKRAT